MTRPFGSLSDDEIQDRLKENARERASIDREIERLEAESKALTSQGLERLGQSMAISTKQTALNEQAILLLKEVQAINVELKIRSDPEFAARFQ